MEAPTQATGTRLSVRPSRLRPVETRQDKTRVGAETEGRCRHGGGGRARESRQLAGWLAGLSTTVLYCIVPGWLGDLRKRQLPCFVATVKVRVGRRCQTVRQAV